MIEVVPLAVELQTWFAAAAAAAAAVMFLLWRWESDRPSRLGRRRNRQGRNAERSAERLLTRAGFRIEARQVKATWPLLVDGEPVQATLRADLLVRRGRRRFVAEVKSGRSGARPDNPDTRRQLLEYRLAFDVDGVLLVDMDARQVRQVEFPALG